MKTNLAVPALAVAMAMLTNLGEPAHAAVTTWGDCTTHFSGSGSWSVPGKLTVGDTGAGSVTITNSSNMTTSRFLYTAMEPGSSGTINLDGGRWYANSWSGIGYGGTGVVNITNGGYWRTDYGTRVYMGEESTASGTVNLSSGSWVVRGDVYVGVSGKATVNITGGSMVVESAGDLHWGSQGKIVLDGGQLRFQTYISLPGPDRFEFLSGTLRIRARSTTWNNSVLAAGCTLLADGGTLSTSAFTATAGSTVTLSNGGRLNIRSNGYASFHTPVSMSSNARIYLESNAQMIHSTHALELNGAKIYGNGQVLVGSAGLNMGTMADQGWLEGQGVYEYDEPTDEFYLVGYDPLVVYGNVSGCGMMKGVTVHGSIDVGASAGQIEMEYVNLGGTTVEMEIGGLTTNLFDRIICGDGVDFTSAIVNISFADGFDPNGGDQFQLFCAADGSSMPASLPNALCSLPENCTLDMAAGVMTYVPEPCTLGLMLAAGAWFIRRR